ncbi:fimbrial protein [Achromobacter marplatensis]|uniref:fimbrial protein n=1 Tax=Achromobacter marplatensis TaxID=470868 RepID=UPI0039F67C6A
MKLNKLALLLATITLGAASSASFAANDGGEITFKGSIIEAPCSIAAESANQTVQMDKITNAALKNGGKSTPKAFQIRLTECDLDDAKKNVTATFSGQTSVPQPDLLAFTSGIAAGASLAIADARGNLIKANTPSLATKLIYADNVLEFQAYLQGDMDGDTGSAIVPGDFTTAATFTLNYQ